MKTRSRSLGIRGHLKLGVIKRIYRIYQLIKTVILHLSCNNPEKKKKKQNIGSLTIFFTKLALIVFYLRYFQIIDNKYAAFR
jgi:hypothetical protein